MPIDVHHPAATGTTEIFADFVPSLLESNGGAMMAAAPSES